MGMEVSMARQHKLQLLVMEAPWGICWHRSTAWFHHSMKLPDTLSCLHSTKRRKTLRPLTIPCFVLLTL